MADIPVNAFVAPDVQTESAEAAMRREIVEELGIVVVAARLLCFVDQIDMARGTHWVAPIYRADAFTGPPRNMEPAKHHGPEWFPLDAMPDALTTPTKAAMAALRTESLEPPFR
ncbi:NUDIX domain-containing protein [Sphingomonadaceae bacterium OTU29MARTA1]|nr:NUDIX domain-containing protein [Sphingomonadaceae bacterium OTU29MARTA1]